MRSMDLYYSPASFNSRRALGVIEHLGVRVEKKVVDLMKGEQRAEKFLALNPNGKVPVLVDGDYVLWESHAIMQYVAEKYGDGRLWPNDIARRADVTRWMCWGLAHWQPACGAFVYERVFNPVFGRPTDENVVKQGERELEVLAKVLNAQLEGREWITGKELTLADFSLAAPLTYAAPARIPLSPYPNILRWNARMNELESWRSTAPQQ
jgi:glutathione S-transferase